jgi:hypothetical protein
MPLVTTIQIVSYGNWALNFPVIFRLQYDASVDCWNVYSLYSNWLATYCNAPVSGLADMARETNHSYYGTLPVANFGNATSGSNNALRLHNATAWEVWDSTLAANGTATSDFRNTTPPYYISAYAVFYHIKTYGG